MFFSCSVDSDVTNSPIAPRSLSDMQCGSEVIDDSRLVSGNCSFARIDATDCPLPTNIHAGVFCCTYVAISSDRQVTRAVIHQSCTT